MQACVHQPCKIEVLNLAYCKIKKTQEETNPEDTKNFSEQLSLSLPKIPNLRELSLANNAFTNSDMLAIVTAAGQMPHLEILDISNIDTSGGPAWVTTRPPNDLRFSKSCRRKP